MSGSHHNRSSSNVEHARRFLWDHEDAESGGAHNRRTNLSSRGGGGGGSGFSTRDFNVVDQSVNLMDLGSGGGTGTGSTNLSNSQPTSSTSNSLSGLFRAKMESQHLTKFTDENYGDADAMNQADAEEYISNKRRRRLPFALSNLKPKVWLTLGVALVGFLLVFTSFQTFVDQEKKLKDNESNSSSSSKTTSGSKTASGKNNDTSNTSSNTSSSSSSSVDPVLQQRFADFKQRILDEHVSPEDAFDANVGEKFGGSPQQQALDWIVQEDPAKLPHDHPAMLDRYGLAVLYFGMGEYGWKKGEHWLSNKGICYWQGIECPPKDQEPTEENDFKPYATHYDADASVIAIQIQSNLLRGTIPDELGSAFKELKIIDLEDNQLTGTLPLSLAANPHLRTLLLGNNELTGTLPEEYASLTNLHQLSVSHNKLSGSISKDWETSLTKLRYFGASYNQLKGNFPDLTKLTRLTGLFLQDNEMEGPLPESLEGMTSLLDLKIGNNKFTGTIDVLDALSNLETLDLSNNAFSGTIPDMFDKIFRLHELSLAKNKFEGSIPHTMTHLQVLKTLNLESNQLGGNLPKGLGLLRDVVTISLRDNQFEGSIPTYIGKLDDIKTLYLNNNKLTGTIPAELGLCFRMKHLHLQHNQLNGSIPSELGSLDGLANMKLEGNAFEGAKMPPPVCALREDDLAILTSDCKNSKKVECDCCTECL